MKQVQLGCVLFTCALVITVFMIVALHIVLQVPCMASEERRDIHATYS